MSDSPNRDIIAAVDLGSNSFHMIVGELRHGQLAIIDRIRETVRIAESLSPEGDLSTNARYRALECLSRFGQRLREVEAGNVRAAGTATIRRIREDSNFMRDAEQSLGHPIDIISGLEEARLVYSGVSHSLPPTDRSRLVTDIGGGSTEIILGQASTPHAMESLHMGCVTMTERFFPGGLIAEDAFAKARLAARLELRPVKAFFRDATDLHAIGTSGTIRATLTVAQQLGLAETGLSLATIESQIEIVKQHDSITELSLKGLSNRRAQVWPGGLSILAELIDTLRIDEMNISDGALREGLLYDLLGRLQHEDARERTVSAMAARYHVDLEQAGRVADAASNILNQCAGDWGVDDDFSSLVLEWAARLHEIGLDISHDGYQRHGAYIAEHADMPGFPQAEQRYLSILIGGQRHRVDASRSDVLPRTWRDPGLKLLIILRLAVLLNRARSGGDQPELIVSVSARRLSLKFNQSWLAANPLTVVDLEGEQKYLAQVGFQLDLD